jgi:hypothetical protein
MKCCDDKEVDFTLAFTVPGSPRVPADGAPLEAYFDNFVTVAPGFEMDHPIVDDENCLQLYAPMPDVVIVCPLKDEDACERPQLAFAIGAILSGS